MSRASGNRFRGKDVRKNKGLEYFQQKCETALRPEMRPNQKDRAVPAIPFKQEPLYIPAGADPHP
jgi:hypothetical protein